MKPIEALAGTDLKQPERGTVHAKRFLSATERMAIVAAVASGRTKLQVSQEFKVHRNTVSQLCKSVREEVQNPANPLSDSWRETQMQLAVKSVNRALSDASDVYKSGNIGVQALKGLGVYSADTVSVNVAAWLGSKPAGCEEIEAKVVEENPNR